MQRTVIGGKAPIYALGMPRACPTCHASQWFVGRIVAECAACGDALPINRAIRRRTPIAA